MTSIAPRPYSNQAIKLSAYVKTVNVGGYVGLWMRVDGAGNQILSLDNIQTKRICCTTDWAQYETILDVPENRKDLINT